MPAEAGVDDDLVLMGLLVDRRDELGRARAQTISRLYRLPLELVPGAAKQFLSARRPGRAGHRARLNLGGGDRDRAHGRLRGAMLGVAVIVTCAATCERNDTFSFTNSTQDTVVVQLMDATGRPVPVATLKPGQQGSTNVGGDEQACDPREYRAVTDAGVVVDRVTRECGGQAWSVPRGHIRSLRRWRLRISPAPEGHSDHRSVIV